MTTDPLQARRELVGMALGVLGVALFSQTFPATRVAVAEMPPLIVGFGRAVVAAACGGLALWLGRATLPTRREALQLVLVGLCVALGFPYFSAVALKTVSAAHGGVMLGLLPLVTVIAGVIVNRERPSLAFWLTAAAGSTSVVAFALLEGGGALRPADLYLVVAMVCAATGYAIGARLTHRLGGWQVISWALVVTLPVTLPPVLWNLDSVSAGISSAAWAGFLYVALFSQLIAFFAWYRGLALGGVARVGQTQLLQPFMTILGAAVLIGERLDAVTVGFAALVVAIVAVGRRMPVRVNPPAR